MICSTADHLEWISPTAISLKKSAVAAAAIRSPATADERGCAKKNVDIGIAICADGYTIEPCAIFFPYSNIVCKILLTYRLFPPKSCYKKWSYFFSPARDLGADAGRDAEGKVAA